MKKYVCYYKIKGSHKSVVLDDFYQVRYGFWIDEQGNLAKKEPEAKFYIPPHRIEYVVTQENDEQGYILK